MTGQAGGRAHRPADGRHPTGRHPRHAVVIGASFAGLLAARVLSDCAERVTIVERDRGPAGPELRPGVPQARHTHVLLRSGQEALETLLPGILSELREYGAPLVGMPSDVVHWQGGRWYRRTTASAHLLTGSRPLTEWLVRRRVLAGDRITAVEGTDVVGLLGDVSRVRGVLLRERGTAGVRQDPDPLPADLVVDASGRGSRAPGWLTAIGAEPPREETVESGLAYASRLYQGSDTDPELPYRGFYVVPNTSQTRGAVVLPLEGGRWIVTLSGLRGDEPPTDETGFVEYAAKYPHPFIHDWLSKAEPASRVHGFRQTTNVRRRYDEPSRRPAGFLAVGDALCTFNPIYGQGMAVAAMSAVALRDALRQTGRTATTRRVQQRLLDASQQAWEISAGTDKKMPGAVGSAVATSPADRAVDWYMNRVQAHACGDPAIGAVFRDVLGLAAPLTALFAPRIAKAVLFGRPPRTPSEPPMTPETPDTTH